MAIWFITEWAHNSDRFTSQFAFRQKNDKWKIRRRKEWFIFMGENLKKKWTYVFASSYPWAYPCRDGSFVAAATACGSLCSSPLWEISVTCKSWNVLARLNSRRFYPSSELSSIKRK